MSKPKIPAELAEKINYVEQCLYNADSFVESAKQTLDEIDTLFDDGLEDLTVAAMNEVARMLPGTYDLDDAATFKQAQRITRALRRLTVEDTCQD